MRDIPKLVDGYRRFLDGRYAEQAALYRALADKGQKPKTMIIACCDSRADPATIFDASPGELFIVRNVANLVPPFEPMGDYHGTSAALEFAVTKLEVESVVVMGHARCGGISAFLAGLFQWQGKQGFIDRWMSLLNAARSELLRDIAGQPPDVQQQALEHAAVRCSLENLQTFPFVNERVEDGRLRLRGAYFDIADGRLLALDPETRLFQPLD